MMRFFKPFLFLVLPLQFLVFNQSPAIASKESVLCENSISHWAIGWYINTKKGERSKDLDGRLTRCSNDELTIDIFESPNYFSTTNATCHSISKRNERFCGNRWKLNKTYVWGLIFDERVGNNPMEQKLRHHFPYQSSMRNRTTCAQANDSAYEYCFKQGKPFWDTKTQQKDKS